MAWTQRLSRTQDSTAELDNRVRTAQEFKNFATKVFELMSNSEFESVRGAVHEIHVIESQILNGTLNKTAAIHNFNVAIKRA